MENIKQQPEYSIYSVNDVEFIVPNSFDANWPFFDPEKYSLVNESYEQEITPTDLRQISEQIQLLRIHNIDPTGIFNFNFLKHQDKAPIPCTGVIYDSSDGPCVYFSETSQFPGN